METNNSNTFQYQSVPVTLSSNYAPAIASLNAGLPHHDALQNTRKLMRRALGFLAFVAAVLLLTLALSYSSRQGEISDLSKSLTGRHHIYL